MNGQIKFLELSILRERLDNDIRYKITASDPGATPPSVLSYGYPWFSEYWLKGFGTASSNYDLCIEVWYKSGGSDVCYYDEHCLQSIDVKARKGNPDKDDDDGLTSPVINEDVKIRPNPSNGVFEIYNVEKGMVLKIFDINGRLVFNEESINNQVFIDLNNNPSGLYILKIFSSNGEMLSTKKLAKQ